MGSLSQAITAREGRLIYCGEIIRDRGEMLSLTDMWRAAGSPDGRAPSDWLALASTKEFVDCVATSLNAGISGIKTKKGRGGGTDAHWQIGLAFAKYLSPEFHMWVNSVVRERMEGRVARPGAAVIPFDEAARRAIGGIVKAIVHAEVAALCSTIIPQLLAAELAKGLHMVRRGKTAGQIYREAGFPPLKGISSWLGNLWVRLGFQIEGNGHGELGDRTARLFDPDKVSAWLRTGGRSTVERKLAERRGQTVLHLVPPRVATEEAV